MGQPIAVTRRPSPRPDQVRFEINRSLTGMGHEHYEAGQAIITQRPPDALAQRMFEIGKVRSVHIYSNIITVDIEPGVDVDALERTVRDLYVYYHPGVEPSYSE